ncbi:hypothetical protein HRI_000321600 [Hibiscus trionum]|uniref:Protein FAR1-RELATED SEQUENCE n=1 Tax=Hibiscus trionum TaxID=183268 RepID=A0A9W7GWJ3_HIBTR|nr:hypothetical protein HRI_000321600 [Hibiscus trionum]
MITTGRSESINAFIKRFVFSHTCLTDFVKHVNFEVQEISQGRMQLNMVATLRPTSLKTKSPLEEHGFQIFTPFAFKRFKEEITRVSQYSIIHIEGNEFIVRYFDGEKNISHKVFWDGDTTMCSCKNFEFWGILYRHILRVFFHQDCFKVSSFYLPVRWCCDALQASSTSKEAIDEYIPLSNALGVEEVLPPPQSKKKGRLKKKRDKGGKELGKKC